MESKECGSHPSSYVPKVGTPLFFLLPASALLGRCLLAPFSGRIRVGAVGFQGAPPEQGVICFASTHLCYVQYIVLDPQNAYQGSSKLSAPR